MFTYLILLFTILPAIELAILIEVGGHIGAGNTIMLIILTGIAGATLARIQGFAVLQNIQAGLARDQMPTESMLDGVMILCGGIVLLTPGFITDILGFFLLIPLTRKLIKYWVQKKIKQHILTQSDNVTFSSSSDNNHRDFEDADFRD